MDRRMVVAMVDQDMMVDVLFNTPKMVRHEFEGLPTDAEVVSVHHIPTRLAFTFTLRHPSFPEVPIGEDIPQLPVKITTVAPRRPSHAEHFVDAFAPRVRP